MIHSTRIAVAGGTADQDYGSKVDLDMETYSAQAVALICIGADATATAAEGQAGMLRINCSSLGLVDQVIPIGPYQTSGPATNHSGYPCEASIIPVDWALNGKEKFKVDIAPRGLSTVAKLYEVAMLWSDNKGQPKDWKEKFPNVLPMTGGDMVGAKQITTTRTALNTIEIPDWAKEIIAVQALIMKVGAITAAEEAIGYVDFTSTLSGIAPQEYPVSFAQGATLGTPVGGGQFALNPPWIPTHIPLTGKTETIRPFINLRTAVTTDCDVSFAIKWR
tara:strand:+ start:373 stop:1203 length:831 start_codon:yes stop_codon:yes gene_type:complete